MHPPSPMDELVGPAVELLDGRVLGLGEVGFLAPPTMVMICRKFACWFAGLTWRVDGVAFAIVFNEAWFPGAVKRDLAPLRVLVAGQVPRCWMDGSDVSSIAIEPCPVLCCTAHASVRGVPGLGKPLLLLPRAPPPPCFGP